MMTMRLAAGLLPLLLALSAPAPGLSNPGVDVAAFARKETFGDIKISPTGEYLAAIVPMEDRTGLAILRKSDGSRTAAFALGKDIHVADFEWVNAERVIMSIAKKLGQLDQPQLTGELYGINFDGTRRAKLLGGRSEAVGAATRVSARGMEDIYAELIDTLPGEDGYVIVSITPNRVEPFTRAERIDVLTGRGRIVARVPVQRAQFSTDNDGVVRFARGADRENYSKLFYRTGEDAEWQLINDEAQTRLLVSAIGFSPDGKTAYLRSDQPRGPDAIIAFDAATGNRTPVLAGNSVDPWRIIRQMGASNAPVGMMLMDGKPRSVFFDEQSEEARLYRSLEQAFAGQAVVVTSTTHDGRYALVYTFADTNPGDYYVFDRETKRAEHVISSRDWFDPDDMATMQPVSLPARDGRTLHGYVTRPPGAGEGRLPMVVLPHGGPFGVFDQWGFRDDVQMLARAGYAVLQVNYRGSGNHGREFLNAGARQWGGTMQDDVTDATRWAVAQGIAHADRICIYGASYGAYAALVGVAREPELYACAVGYIGVYDLALMHRQDSHANKPREIWLNDWVGERSTLGARSPTTMADRIKVPVFLAAGGEDRVTPIEHSRAMEAALKRAGVPVETLYYPTEGHGFYAEHRRVEYYAKLLEFLSLHLGGAKAKPAKKGA